MKEIKLTQGKVAFVDDEDYEYLSQFKWFAQKATNIYYAVRKIRINNRQTCRYMHREIMNTKERHNVIDHIDNNGINNQKINLRVCTCRENTGNSRKGKGTSSKYKGVSWENKKRKWRAYIVVHYKQINLGRFINEQDAAEAYNKAAKEIFGEFAKLNKI